MKKRSLLIGALAAAMVLSGCGSASKQASEARSYDGGNYAMAAEEAAYDYDYDYEDYAEEAPAEAKMVNAGSEATADQVSESAATTTNRKLIRTVNLSVETTDYEGIINNIKAKVNQLGGYFESMNEYRNAYGSDDTKSANMTIRIPKEKADTLLNSLEEQTNVRNYGENMEDVTLAYVDMDSHKKALQSEEERLMKLMDQAESIEDLIVLEQRLSDVRYQIESMESQLRTYDNRVEYTTIYLDVQEVVHITPVAEPGFFSKIGAGFSENLYDVVDGFLNFIIGVITAIPYLIVWGIILAILFFVGRIIVRKARKAIEASEEKSFEKRAERMAKMNELREKAQQAVTKGAEKVKGAPEKSESEAETRTDAEA